jgi:hypothetical protein
MALLGNVHAHDEAQITENRKGATSRLGLHASSGGNVVMID